TALAGDEDDRVGAADLLRQAAAALDDAARFDPALETHAEALSAALAEADELQRTLRDYAESVEADPTALEQTAERLFLISDLKRKYGESLPEVLAYAEDARRRLGDIERRSERLAELETRARELEAELGVQAQALSARRREAASQLAGAVEAELADLRLSGA